MLGRRPGRRGWQAYAGRSPQTISPPCRQDRHRAYLDAISIEDPYWPELSISTHPDVITAAGGKERADSVLSALKALQGLAAEDDWVLVHDAARPCLTASDIHLQIATLKDDAVGGILALSSHDTLKHVDGDTITATIDRKHIWRALTPQMKPAPWNCWASSPRSSKVARIISKSPGPKTSRWRNSIWSNKHDTCRPGL
jgi:2-C-methyl-D-erythritol 4-phosphate cytidylyltransferase